MAGRALLTGADAAAQRTAPGLGSAATQASSAFAAATHGHTVADVTGLQTARDAKASSASPTFTRTRAALTAASGTNITQVATTAFVAAAMAALFEAAPGALDTLYELATALGDDQNFATTITNGLAAKQTVASNLSDLTNAVTTRTNLGLGTMATRAAPVMTRGVSGIYLAMLGQGRRLLPSVLRAQDGDPGSEVGG